MRPWCGFALLSQACCVPAVGAQLASGRWNRFEHPTTTAGTGNAHKRDAREHGKGRLNSDPHFIWIVAFGLLALGVAWIPLFLSRIPLSLPMICLTAGGLIQLPGLHDPTFPSLLTLLEHLNEIILVIALVGAGLSIDRRIGLYRWSSTWRLLGVGMPLSFAAIAVLSWAFGDFALATALLIGALLTPTDPVLASGLSVGPPGAGEEGEVRQALTTEAGLNDGLAAPFVMLAIAVSKGSPIGTVWMLEFFVWKLCLAAAVGWALGRVMSWLQFEVPGIRESDRSDGLAALGLGFIVYGATEMLGGYGLVAVFLAAVRLREGHPEDATHGRMAEFTGQIESLAAMLVVIIFAAAVWHGLLSALTWRDAVLGASFLLLVRPICAYLALVGSPHPFVARAATAFFGIRGIGTLYYLMYCLGRGSFSDHSRITALVCSVVFASIVLHGMSATPVMKMLDRRRLSKLRPREN